MKKVLIIDDDHEFLNDLSIMLPRNFQVHQAESSPEALRLYKKFKFDLCIIDVQLPVYFGKTTSEEGFALAEKILKMNNQQNIIFISSSALPKAEVNIPAFSFLKKPFKIPTLLKLITPL
ncbi:MAG: response regulator [Calditrichales bacterium]|nr:response regulator [Calditrichales bacterium]